MSVTLVEVINNYSLSDLHVELEKLHHTVTTKLRTVEVATLELENARNALQLVRLAIKMREGPEAQNGLILSSAVSNGDGTFTVHRAGRGLSREKFQRNGSLHIDHTTPMRFIEEPADIPKLDIPTQSSPISNGNEPDKTTLMLETLRRSNGMRPAQLYKSLLARGVEVGRPYVFTVLQRLKKRELVSVNEEGEYFALEKRYLKNETARKEILAVD